MRDKITEWVNFLSLKVTPRTAEIYEYHLRHLADYAPERKADEWSAAHLINYLGERKAAGGGECMLKQMVGAFRNFFRYTCGDASPAQSIPYPKVHRRKQRTLDYETALKVLASCDTSTNKGTRDLAILTLMLDTGLRAAEVCRLDVAKVDMVKRRFVVMVKGGNEESGVFSKTTAANLARWLSIRGRYSKPEETTLFVSLPYGLRLTRDGLRATFHHIGKKVGLSGFAPHDLRRTFATIAIKEGAPTRVVQAAGRWGDISMVERYTAEIQAEDFERYSPVEALMNRRE